MSQIWAADRHCRAPSERSIFPLQGIPGGMVTAVPAKLVEALAGRYTIEKVIRETVDWLDRYLGAVATRP